MMSSKKTVLVVEDEQSFVNVITRALENKGLEVDVQRNIDDAMESLQKKDYDALWIDHYLPNGTGLDLVHKLRKDKRYDNVAIFLVSNTADANEVYNYIELGVQKYYVKAEHRLGEIVDEIYRVLKSNG